MSLADTRLKYIARAAALIRRNIVKNGGAYYGIEEPNLQSIIDLATMPDHRTQAEIEKAITELDQS